MSQTLSLTLHEARARAALVSAVSYDLELDLTQPDTFGCRAVVRFDCARPGATTFVEFADAREVRIQGADATYADGRILLRDLAARNEITIEARVPYVSDGEGMHRIVDPVDGETYISAYCGMDMAQRVFPCFDQNDLKAPITLRVIAPTHWTVLANGHVSARAEGNWEFATTPPIPPIMFVMCGGPWASVTWEHAGLPFGWHARASLAEQLQRDAEELRSITTACFDRYAEIFDEPYPFDSYDQAMVPGQNWGALETPGCITYRDELLPLGPPSEPERRTRAMIIAHEMAHMWFGDLVTMTWWEDTWLQESFADYLGFRVAEEAAGIEGAFADFTIGRKPDAYLADVRRSTHPVAPRPEDVPDVDAAMANFDSLSYAKGNSALRQLVTCLGDDAFFAGVNTYLSRHRWGNATLTDFVAALDEQTDRDVVGWVDRWLRTTGFDTIAVTRTEDGFVIARDGSRPHRLRVTAYGDDWRATSSFVDLGAAEVRLPAARLLVPNAGGETYARIRLDPDSWTRVVAGLSSIPDASTRAVLWSTAFDLVWIGELSAEAFLALLERHLPTEPQVEICHRVLVWTRAHLLPRFVGADQASGAVARIAATCLAALDRSFPDPAKAVVLTRTLAGVSNDPELLLGWLSRGVSEQGVAVDPTLGWLARRRLAALGHSSVGEIQDARRRERTLVADLGAARALAAPADPAVKAAAWARLTGDPVPSNREFEAIAAGLWDVEQTELLGPQVDAYLSRAVPLGARRGASHCNQLADAFPTVALTPAQITRLAETLDGDVPVHLRRPWEDQLDDLRRASAARRGR